MSKQSEELAKALSDNLNSLADRIARKPPVFDPRWAKSIVESFSLYTRTSTINLFVLFGDSLCEAGWPFPAYLDLEAERRHLSWALKFVIWPSPFFNFFSYRSINLHLQNISLLHLPEAQRKDIIDGFLSRRFHKVSKKVFAFWKAHPMLASKKQLISDLEKAYYNKLWGTCIPSILPLIDYLMRDYFQTNDLFTSVSTLVNAFNIAKLTPETVKPGTYFADSVETDLRLPGVYLTSFLNFAFRYYSWHTTASNPEEVNRHAVLHGDMNYWSRTQTIKVLMFFDLLVKLEPVLRIIIGTANVQSKDGDEK